MPSADERYDEAIALQEAGNLDGAIEKLESLAADEPDFVLAHAGLSAFYSKLERHDEAVRSGEKVCMLDPDDPFSHMAMSLVCQKAGKLAEAEKAMGESMQKQWADARNQPESE